MISGNWAQNANDSADDDPNHSSWPSGPGYEEVQYLKAFTK